MSSISASERRQYEDRLRETREEYENREAEANKRKAAEMKRMQQQQQKQLDSLSDGYEKRIADLQSHSREVITERDQANRNDIEEVRKMHQEQLRKKTVDAEFLRKAQVEAYEGALEKQKNISNSQKENLASRMNAELKEKDKTYGENIEKNRAQLKVSTGDIQDRMNAAHQKEINLLTKNKDEQQLQAEANEQAVKRYYAEQIDDLNRKNQKTDNNWRDRYFETVQNMQDSHGEQLEQLRTLQKDDRENTISTYRRKLDEKSRGILAAQEKYQDSTGSRIDGQIRSKNSQIGALKDKLSQQVELMNRQKETEKKNLANSYEDRISLLENQKEQITESMQDLNRDRIAKNLKGNDKLLQEVNRNHKLASDIKDQRHKAEVDNLKATHSDQMEYFQNTTENYVHNVENNSNKKLTDMEEYFERSREAMKSGYNDKLEKHQEKTAQDFVQLNKVMTERFRSMEKNYNQKMEYAIKSYEERLEQMKTDQQKELLRMDANYKQKIKDQSQGLKVEKNSLEDRYENKISVLEEQHKVELEKMNRRHQEDMQNLATRLNSYSKKA